VASVKASTAANVLPRIAAPWRQLASTGSTATVNVTRVTDPLCPWDYSFEPTMRTLESRYGDQLKMRTVVIGLVTGVENRLAQGYSPEHAALAGRRFGRWGRPLHRAFAIGRWRACRRVGSSRQRGAGRSNPPCGSRGGLDVRWMASGTVSPLRDRTADQRTR
jgi:hypothetical protein